jgi:hypothetical protein
VQQDDASVLQGGRTVASCAAGRQSTAGARSDGFDRSQSRSSPARRHAPPWTTASTPSRSDRRFSCTGDR